MKIMKLSTEVIDFQRDDTGSQIEAILYKMLEKVKNQPNYILEKSPEDTELSIFIEKRFGFKTEFSYGTDPQNMDPNEPYAACLTMRITPYHVLDNPMLNGKVVHDLERKKTSKMVNLKGMVDLKKAKVSGLFSKYPLNVYFHVKTLHYQLKTTVPEMTAILLHELGHPFTYFEFSSRLSSNNQILQHLADAFRTNNKKQIEYVFKEITLENNIDQKTFDDLIDEDNRLICGLRFFQRYIGVLLKGLPNGKYNETASEQLADNFASRFGYGREIITGLDKLYTGAPEKSGITRAIFNMFELIAIITVLAIPIAALPILAQVPELFLHCLIMVIAAPFVLYYSGDNYTDMTYDRLKIRYKRIRQQYLEALKLTDLSKEEIIKFVEDIKAMDKIINETVLYRSLINRLSNFLFSINRNTKKDIEFQQLLEELAHNDLFLKSAELTVL